VSDDAQNYYALDLLSRLRDAGPISKRIPLCVVDALREAADEIECLREKLAEARAEREAYREAGVRLWLSGLSHADPAGNHSPDSCREDVDIEAANILERQVKAMAAGGGE